jgi:hypothetical protein
MRLPPVLAPPGHFCRAREKAMREWAVGSVGHKASGWQIVQGVMSSRRTTWGHIAPGTVDEPSIGPSAPLLSGALLHPRRTSSRGGGAR